MFDCFEAFLHNHHIEVAVIDKDKVSVLFAIACHLQFYNTLGSILNDNCFFANDGLDSMKVEIKHDNIELYSSCIQS